MELFIFKFLPHFIFGAVVLGGLFWLWMFWECMTKESGHDKTVWLLVILFINVPGAFLYYILRRQERLDEAAKLAQSEVS